MNRLSLVATALLLLTGAFAQTLNKWPGTVFAVGGGTTNHTSEDAVDGDVTTYGAGALPQRLGVLFNKQYTFAGFYIQSSGDFITDYSVSATDWSNYPFATSLQIGQVCGATSNFTLVLFTNAAGQPYMRSDTFFVEVSASRGNAAIINEIWPIYLDDIIYHPNNNVACPTPTPTPTPSASPSPTPTLPSISLSHWKSANRPIPVAQASSGHSSSYAVDNNVATYWSYPIAASYDLLFNHVDSYQGFYILSAPDAYITDYSIIAYNGTSKTMWNVGSVSGATSEFTVVKFQDEQDNVETITTDSFYINVTGSVDGIARIAEVYPIFAGDTIVEP